MKTPKTLAILALIYLSLPGCYKHEEQHEGQRKVVVTSPKAKDVVITQQYVCQIHSQQHIEVRALMDGYLETIPVKEGQVVKEGDLLFKVVPTLYKAKWDNELAEVKIAEMQLEFTKSLAKDKAVSKNEVALYDAKLKKAQAKANLAEQEYNFTKVKAPFDGIVDRLREQKGSLVKERDILSTLSDNRVMWVYYYVPEKQYQEYMKAPAKEKEDQVIELQLANGTKHVGKNAATGKIEPIRGKIGAIEAQFNNETGNIPFRADFPNPDGLLRHGMTGNILIHKTLHNAIVIPQRATFEVLDRRYVYVVDSDSKVHRRQIHIYKELPDIFVIQSGVSVDDKIVFEGVRQVHDGDAVEYDFRAPEQILDHQKNHAE